MDAPEFTRDLRSANHPSKRDRDSRSKWAYGSACATDVKLDHAGNPQGTLSAGQQAKLRPLGKWSEVNPCYAKTRWDHNVVKLRVQGGHNREMPCGRLRTKIYAQEESQDLTNLSLLDLDLDTASPLAATVPAGVERRLSISENVLYSFDRADSPGFRRLDLSAYIKPGRDTERLVEKEYEVLDANGIALRGRRARRHLQKTAAAAQPAAAQPAAATETATVATAHAETPAAVAAPVVGSGTRAEACKKKTALDEDDDLLSEYEWV